MLVKNRIYNNTLYVLLSGELDEHSAYNTRITLDELFENNVKFKNMFYAENLE